MKSRIRIPVPSKLRDPLGIYAGQKVLKVHIMRQKFSSFRPNFLAFFFQQTMVGSYFKDPDLPRLDKIEGEYRLIQTFAWTDPRKYSFADRAVDPWNKLPDDLVGKQQGTVQGEDEKRLKKCNRCEA
jgi:hypothetical protein